MIGFFPHTNPYISNVMQQCRWSLLLIFRTWATCASNKFQIIKRIVFQPLGWLFASSCSKFKVLFVFQLWNLNVGLLILLSFMSSPFTSRFVASVEWSLLIHWCLTFVLLECEVKCTSKILKDRLISMLFRVVPCTV